MLSDVVRAVITAVVAALGMAATPCHADPNPEARFAFIDLLREIVPPVRLATPEWLERRKGIDPLARGIREISDDVRLVVQEGGLDGTDVLTVRYPIDTEGRFRTFIGAGVGRGEYYDEQSPGAATTPLTMRDTRDALGAVAEVGSEWQVSERMRFQASVRWADVANDARALRTEHGPVAAQPLALGLLMGYRFR